LADILVFYLLRLRRYKAKGVKTRCYQEGVGQFERRFQREGVVPGEYFFRFYKTRHILLSDSANCTVLRAVVLTQYRRVTDGKTDGIAVASTALAKQRAVKIKTNQTFIITLVKILHNLGFEQLVLTYLLQVYVHGVTMHVLC